jgi:hypothetical protein
MINTDRRLKPAALGRFGGTRAIPHYISTTMSVTPGTRVGAAASASRQLVLVQNWFEDRKRLAPGE